MGASPTNSVAKPGADLRHIDTWIFDLDNTLYHADSNLFAQIEQRMTEFIAQKFDIHPGEAYTLQHMYYRSFGSTLHGLMESDNVDPEEFLAYIHKVDLSMLRPDLKLRQAIARLPGRRCVFTNGCRNHVARILKRIGLEGEIHNIWDIRTTKFVPKPRPEAFQSIVDAGAFDPHTAAMFDDTARNLIPAYAMGMTTVWLNAQSPDAVKAPVIVPSASSSRRHIRYEIDDLADFLQTIRL